MRLCCPPTPRRHRSRTQPLHRVFRFGLRLLHFLTGNRTMKTNPSKSSLKSILTIRFHLTDGSVHSFVQTDDAAARKLWEGVDPARLFVRPRFVVGSEHSKPVFASAETVRVDFLHNSFQCWEFPGGYSDICEVSYEEFLNKTPI